MNTRAVVVLLALLAGAGPAVADPLRLASGTTQVPLLELYTSEGCSSCPPADRWLSRLESDERLWRDVVPVAFHVDYWDYIGWKDRFADPRFGARQRDYARAGHVSTVYTPGLVLNGREWRSWFRRPELELEPGPEVGSLAVSVDGSRFIATFAPAGPSPGRLEVHVSRLGFGIRSDVDAGENRGRILEQNFVVLAYAREPMKLEGPRHAAVGALPDASHAAPRSAVVAWVSRTPDPRPVQSVGGWVR